MRKMDVGCRGKVGGKYLFQTIHQTAILLSWKKAMEKQRNAISELTELFVLMKQFSLYSLTVLLSFLNENKYFGVSTSFFGVLYQLGAQKEKWHSGKKLSGTEINFKGRGLNYWDKLWSQSLKRRVWRKKSFGKVCKNQFLLRCTVFQCPHL